MVSHWQWNCLLFSCTVAVTRLTFVFSLLFLFDTMLEWQKNLLGRSTIITFDIWWGGGIGICGGVNPSFWSFNGIDDLMISISSIILCHYFVNKEQIKWLPTEPINWIILLCWVAKVHFIKKVNSFGILSNWSEFVRIKLKKKNLMQLLLIYDNSSFYMQAIYLS